MDIVGIACVYGFIEGNPLFRANSDLDEDGAISIFDLVLCLWQYGKDNRSVSDCSRVSILRVNSKAT